MYDHTLHREIKHFCRYCLQAFRTPENFKCNFKDCFKIISKQTFNMPMPFNMPFKSCLRKTDVYNCTSSVIEESKYCSDVMEKYFSKELVMSKKNNEDFENSTKCWICYHYYIDVILK